MKNTHMYIWKIATIILSFVMIVGLWSGITLDAKAEETQKITEVELLKVRLTRKFLLQK